MDQKRVGLQGSEALAYHAFGQQFPVLLVILDSSLTVNWASPGSETLLGFRPEQLVGHSVVDMVHPDDVTSAVELANDVVMNAEAVIEQPAASVMTEFPVRVRRLDGGWVPCRASGRILDAEGTMLGVIRSATEIETVDAVIAGLGAGGDLESVLLAITDLVCSQFRVDLAWVIHDADGPTEVVCRDCDASSRSPRVRLDQCREVLAGDVLVEDGIWTLPILSATGETLFGVIELPAPLPGGPAPLDRLVLSRVASLASIAFARHRDDLLLTEAATIDFLTGVANRRHFESRLAESALAEDGLPLTLLYLDVDDFKFVNDTHGHHAGDRVLVAVAARLANTVRPCDFVGRLGGDEFAVGAPGLNVSQREGFAGRVREAIERPISVDGSIVHVRVSIGIASADDEDALETILERGDDDMFARKRVNR